MYFCPKAGSLYLCRQQISFILRTGVYTMERRRELDGLRGLAAFIVLVSHVSNRTGLWGNLLGHGGGRIGVMIFFCLSGYLMGTLYLSSPFRPVEVWRYALHRFARVAPLYYLVVFVRWTPFVGQSGALFKV